MSFINTIKVILISGIFLILQPTADGQVVVEKSKDKVIISGNQYYIHLVKKGETTYSISRAYGVSIEELTKENPPALYGINEGQTLRIPVREMPESSSPPTTTAKPLRDETRFIYHKLLPGETVYSLSKLYGASENEIISCNPGVDITKLPVGTEIAVPRKEFMTEKQEFVIQDSKYIFHKVERGESLASIAEKYGLTLRELRRENRNTRFPQVGDYIRIPAPKVPEASVVEVVEPQINDTVTVEPSDSVIVLPRPEGYTTVKNLTGSFDVAVLLPFYLKDNAIRTYIDSSKIVRGKPFKRIVKRPEDWIYSRSLGFVEMYEGILLAADTLRSLGLDINLHVFDIKNDTLELSLLIKQGILSNTDLIIGPVFSSNLDLASTYARGTGIPVVSPVPLVNDTALLNNPELFLTVSSIEVAQNTISKKVGEFFYRNIVFIHSDSAGNDKEVTKFKEKILTELSSRLPSEEIRFKEFLFYNRSAFDNDSINRLSHALSEDIENVVIIASEEAPVISETLMDLHNLSKKYSITVFGYPSMRGIDNLDPKYLFDLDLLIYSPFWIDYVQRDVQEFNNDFMRKFLTQPSELSYAWIGYDIMYYFLSGLAIFGKEFVEHPELHNPDLLQTEFDFRRKSMKDGFENTKLYPVRFTKEYEVKLNAEANADQY